jgi:hypothetical protein
MWQPSIHWCRNLEMMLLISNEQTHCSMPEIAAADAAGSSSSAGSACGE